MGQKFALCPRTIATLLGLVLVAIVAGPEANATVILSGDSNNSTFTNCSGCASGSNSSTVNLASTLPGGSTSTLVIDPTSFTAAGDMTGLPLATLTATIGQKPNAAATFNYNLNIEFATPSGSASQMFGLSLTGNGSPGANGDLTLSNFTLSLSDPLNLTGVELSNFRWVDSGAAGLFSAGTWTITGKGNSADLILEADVKSASSDGDPPSPVPEPSSLALLGTAMAGMVGIGVLRRRATYEAL